MQTTHAYESPTRKQQKEATREHIKRAALACFAERGYGATQIAHITERAGTAKGTFYVHFADKDALLAEYLEEFNTGFAAKLVDAFHPDDFAVPERFLRRVADLFLTYWQENRDFVRAYAEKSSSGVSLHELQFGVNPPMQAFVRSLLERLAAERGASIQDTDLVVQSILAVWLRLGLQAAFNPGITQTQVAETLVRMTQGLIAAALGQLT